MNYRRLLASFVSVSFVLAQSGGCAGTNPYALGVEVIP